MQKQKTNYSQDYTGLRRAPLQQSFSRSTSLSSHPSNLPHLPNPSLCSLMCQAPPTLKICWSSLSSTVLSCYPKGSCHFSFQAPSKTPVLNTVFGHNQPPCPLWGPILCQLVHNPRSLTLSLHIASFFAAQSILLRQKSRQQVVTCQKTVIFMVTIMWTLNSVVGMFVIKFWKQQKM